jgi:hypothetical protein
MWPFTQLKTLTNSRTAGVGWPLSPDHRHHLNSIFMRVYYDRDANANLIKDPARVWQFVIGAACAISAVAIWAG